MHKPISIKKYTTTNKKLKTVITADGQQGFFERGKAIAKLADEGKPIPRKRIINFDSPKEMLSILTKAR